MRIRVASDRNGALAFALGRAVVGLGIVVSGLAAIPALAAGGDDCDSAPLIGAVPYVDTGSTCAPFLNTYAEVCGAEGNSRDVVYAYTPGANGCVNIILCNSTSGVNFKLYVYASACPSPPIACNDTFCAPYARINGLPVNAGVTYWIVVDGSSPACGDYLLEVQPCECTGPQDCADGNACTSDICQAGTCQNPPTPGVACGNPADTECDNPDSCNGAGQCLPNREPADTACGSPADTECDDPDSCDGIGQCLTNPVAAGSPCGNPANTDCDNPDSCNGAGQCQANQETNGTACEDGQFCTVSEQCTGGACTGGQPRVCDDGLACTDDSCNEEADACQFNPTGDCCQAAQDCDDGDPCTLDLCGQGICQHPPAPQGTPCGDPGMSACTTADLCDGAGACQPNDAPNGTACDDGDVCTTNDACSNGFCVGASDPACAECAQGGSPADPTNQVSFQAVMRNAGGQLIDGSVDLVFQFYDDQSTPVGAPIPVNDVAVAGGIVSTAIPIAETIFDGTARELGISIDGTPELSPRIRVTSTPQAFRVGCVDGSSVTPHLGIGNETEGGALRLVGPGTGQVGRVAAASAGLKADVHANCGGTLSLYDYSEFVGEEDTRTVFLSACDGPGGQMVLSDQSGETALWLRAGGGSEAEIQFLDDAGNKVLFLDGEDGDGGALIEIGDSTGPKIELDAKEDNSGSGGGAIYVSNGAGDHTIELDGDKTGADYGEIRIFDRFHNTAIELNSDSFLDAPRISLYNDDEVETVQIIAAANTTNNGGKISLRKAGGGNPTVIIDAEYGDNGPGRIITQELEITGGGDLSEQFEVNASARRCAAVDPSLNQADTSAAPGLLACIDAHNPGELRICTAAYDRTVAGVISGAGGVRPGMLMGQRGSVADGEHPVALTGRVYCWADATHGAIEPGDLLTTADIPGHAMKVMDYSGAQGAVIGKAMTSLPDGQGLVLVLVSLQ